MAKVSGLKPGLLDAVLGLKPGLWDTVPGLKPGLWKLGDISNPVLKKRTCNSYMQHGIDTLVLAGSCIQEWNVNEWIHDNAKLKYVSFR